MCNKMPNVNHSCAANELHLIFWFGFVWLVGWFMQEFSTCLFGNGIGWIVAYWPNRYTVINIQMQMTFCKNQVLKADPHYRLNSIFFKIPTIFLAHSEFYPTLLSMTMIKWWVDWIIIIYVAIFFLKSEERQK